MKVLHVIISVDPRGGGPIEGVFSSSEVWFRHGHVRHIVSLDPPSAEWVSQARAPTVAVGLQGIILTALRRLIPAMRYGYSPRLARWLRANAGNYDAVIVNGLWNYASFGAWRGLHDLPVPYFVFPHGMLDPWFNMAYPTKTVFKSLYWRLFENKVLRDAAAVFYTCEEERRLAQNSFSPYRAREIVVGYGAADISGDPEAQRAAFLAKAPTTAGRKLVLFLSRIHRKKGLDLLIKAFANHAERHLDYDLAIAGPDQSGLQASLTTLAEELGVAGRIHWLGMLTGDAKWGAFRASEFFALPSHQENFGIVVAEAMALSKPLLITDKVNIWREVEGDGAGVVVNDDVAGISDGLARMLAMSDTQRAAMSAAARACFEQRYNLEDNALRLLETIEREISVKEYD